MTKPEVGGRKKKDEEEKEPIDLEQVEQVHEVLVFKGPKEARRANVEQAEEIVDLLSKSTYKAAEYAKPKVRRKWNKFKNSTFGTIAEAAALGAVLITVGVVAGKAAKKWNKKRKAKKGAAADNMSTDTPLADEFLSDAA